MHFKIRTKLIIAFFAIIFPFIIIDAITLYNATTFHKASLKAEAISEELHTVLSLQLALDKALMPGNDYVITGDKKYIDEFSNASRDVDFQIKKLEETFVVLKGMETPEVKEEVEILKAVETAWQNIKEISQKTFEIRNPVGDKEAATLMEEMDYKWAYPAISMLDRYHEIDRKEHAEAIEIIQRAGMLTWGIMIGGIVIIISFSIFFTLFYSKLFTRPIQVIHTRADAITKGEFKTRLDIKTGDEFQQLANAMNEMAAQLDSLYSNLEQKVKERTASLQRSEQKYRTLIENLQEGIWMIDKDANTSYVNPRMAEMLGYTVEEMMGKPLFAFMDERGKEISERNIERRKAGIKEQHDFEFIRKDGTRIYTTIVTTPILDDAGNYAGALAGVINITERKKAEEKTKEHLDYLERFQKVALKREFRIKELTTEIEKLRTELEELKKRNI